MVKVRANSKTCASCDYWGGDRTLAKDQKSVEISKLTVKGICYGKYKHQEKQANYAPSCWIRWRLLNEESISSLLNAMREIVNERTT